MCCHPSLSSSSQIALTLRAVGGLTTAQIARAFLVPEATMAQRISRAKATIKSAGARFSVPAAEEFPERLRAVLHVLYLIFNEGYTSSSGPDLNQLELTSEAIRLTRDLYRQLPDNGEIAGLLALMLLTDARRPARTRADGSLVPLAEQDRSLWNTESIREGVAIVTEALSTKPIGPYQVQAAIAAVHDEAVDDTSTDWPQILELYKVLQSIAPSPVVTLNHAVALAMVEGPKAGLAMLDTIADDPRLATSHRLDAVRAHLLEMTGELDAAREMYLKASRRTNSLPERHYLESRAANLTTQA
jgi:predicted RNA polymerase sigma factor